MDDRASSQFLEPGHILATSPTVRAGTQEAKLAPVHSNRLDFDDGFGWRRLGPGHIGQVNGHLTATTINQSFHSRPRWLRHESGRRGPRPLNPTKVNRVATTSVRTRFS